MNTDNVVYIYSLGEPGTHEVRYIGKTVDLQARLYVHLCDTSNTHKAHWIQSLRAQDKKPVMQVLETLTNPTESEWITSEMFWISHFKAQGFNLTNSSEGGDGAQGYKHSEEIKQHLRVINTGKIMSVESRQKISLNNGNKKFTDEQALDIRIRYNAGGVLQKDLAKEFGVTGAAIRSILTGRNFKHVGGPI